MITRSRPLFLHFGLVVAVVFYTIFGGLAFHLLENPNDTEQGRLHERSLADRTACYKQALNTSRHRHSGIDAALEILNRCNEQFESSAVSRQDWAFLPSIMFAFTIITTIGYGNAAPVTASGRCFCVVYGLIGIPLTMMAIANLGKFLFEHGKTISAKYLQYRAKKRPLDDFETGETEDENFEEISTGKTSVLLFCSFTVYVLIGAVALPLYESEMNFLSAIYFNFVTLTTIGLGDFVPKSNEFLLFTLLYIAVGLALTTISIDVASEYLKKLHYFGRKLTNAGNVTIWFGGKKLSVKGLVESMGAKFGVPPEQLKQALNHLDDFVERAIVAEETNQPIELYDEELKAVGQMEDENANSLADTISAKLDDDGDCLYDCYNVDALSDISVPLLGALSERAQVQPGENLDNWCLIVPDQSSEEAAMETQQCAQDDSGTWSEDEVASGRLEVSLSHASVETMHQAVPDVIVSNTTRVEPEPLPSEFVQTPDQAIEPSTSGETYQQQFSDAAGTVAERVADADVERKRSLASTTSSERTRRSSLGKLPSVIVKVPQHAVGRRDFKHDPKKAFELYQRQWAKFERKAAAKSQQPKRTSLPAASSEKPPATAAGRPPASPRTKRKVTAPT